MVTTAPHNWNMFFNPFKLSVCQYQYLAGAWAVNCCIINLSILLKSREPVEPVESRSLASVGKAKRTLQSYDKQRGRMSLLELICFTSNSSWSRMYSLKKPTLDTSKQRINEVKKTSLHSLELGETLHLDRAKELDLPEEHPLGNNISPAHIFTVRAFKSHGTSCGQTFPSRCTGCIQTIASWWLNQPLWKICSSNWVHLPQSSGWK